MKKTILVMVIVVCVLENFAFCTEILLGTAPISGGGGNRSVASEVLLGIGYENQYGALIGPSWLVNESHLGQIFHVTETHLYFDWMVSHATNGIDEYLGQWITFPEGGGFSSKTMESLKIEKTPEFENEHPDFFDYTITEMTVTLENITISSDDEFTDVYYDGTISFYGIPEPSTLILLGLGAVLLRRKSLNIVS